MWSLYLTLLGDGKAILRQGGIDALRDFLESRDKTC